MSKCYTGTVIAKRDVTVYAETPEEAETVIRQMHESGDACAELNEAEVANVRESDEDGNEFLDVYLFFDDESATMLDYPVLQVPSNTEALTDEMVREILVDFLGNQEHNEKYIPLAASWDRDKMADAMWALCTLILNNAALLKPEHRETVSKVGAALGNCMGSDSSTYNACESFGELLKGLAVRVIPFPMPDLDEGENRNYDE